MRVTVLYSGQSSPSVSWLAIDELAELLAYYLHAELLSPMPVNKAGVWSFANYGKKFGSVESAGGDVLIVIARAPADLNMVNSIKDCRKKFGKIIGFVADSYFEAGFNKSTALYDSISVTGKGDAAYIVNRFGTTVHHIYQGIDTLKWAPKSSKSRDIELISYGRTPPTFHAAFVRRFHDVASEHLYLHSPLGNLSGPTVRDERGMLFKVLQRTRISLAFHLYVEATGARPISMMVTSRWLESLLSGCIVAGKRPISLMADEMLCWNGSTIELSDSPEEAANELVAMLRANDEWEQQRRSNVFNTMMRHDWRSRIKDLCSLNGFDAPAALERDLHLVKESAQQWQ